MAVGLVDINRLLLLGDEDDGDVNNNGSRADKVEGPSITLGNAAARFVGTEARPYAMAG